MPSFTFVATANAVVSMGAKPVFVDILKENYTIDPDDLQKKITKKTRPIIPVHLYGNVASVERLTEISRHHNIPIIEDSAQSLGFTYKKRHTGTFFEMRCYSMYPAKVMTSGEGGFVATDSKKLQDKLLMIRNHGMVCGHDTRVLGLNLRLPEISATIRIVQMKRLASFLKSRKNNARLLSEMLSESGITLLHPRKNENVNYYLYTVASKRHNYLLKRLNSQRKSVPYLTIQRQFRTPFYRLKTRLPVSDWTAFNVLSLPVHPRVTRKNAEFIAKVVREIL